MFSNLGGFNNLTTAGQSMTVFFYSYMEYNSTLAPWTKGSFRAYVKATPCQGFANPCSYPTGHTKTPFFSMFVNRTNDEVDVTFACKKTKCCAVQQLPVYGEASFVKCRFHATVEGSSILATTKFLSGIVVPQKPDTEFEYGCETRKNISVLSHGGHFRKCLGTKNFFTMTSTSKFLQVAFFVNMAPAECGFYHPEVHSDNYLYPPCGRAELPLVETSQTNYTVRYYDPDYLNESYYRFSFNYKQSDRCQKDCLNDRIHLSGPSINWVWNKPKIVPLVWKGWGPGDAGKNWSSNLLISREVNDSCDTLIDSSFVEKDCELVVTFQQEKMTSHLEKKNLTCPLGYDQMDWSCYRLLSSNGNAEDLSTLMTSSMSWSEANTTCWNSGGRLVDITSKREMDGIKKLMFYKWWQTVLKYIPGFKFIHIGLQKVYDNQGFFWTTGRVMGYLDWAVPDFHHQNPEQTMNETNKKLIPTIPSEYLAELGRQLHPVMGENYSCVLMRVVNPHQGTSWMTIPCNQTITSSLALCEAEPVSSEINLQHAYANGTAFKSFIKVNKNSSVMHSARFDCPLPYVQYNGRCLMVFGNSKTSKSPGTTRGKLDFVQRMTLIQGCKAPTNAGKLDHLLGTQGYPLQVNETDVEWLNGFLNMIHFSPDLGWIRLAKERLTNESDVNTTSDCFYLAGELVYDDRGMKPSYLWHLHDLDPCTQMRFETHPLYYFICETDLRATAEKCLDNQFTCGDGSCILDHLRCNGNQDCLNGEDEKFCSWSCSFKRGKKGNCVTDCHRDNCTCNHLFFQCISGGCRPISKVCDYEQDCPDNSDELVCASPPCRPAHFRCRNTQCIPMDSRCDMKQDCVDGSDEEECFQNGYPVEGNMAAQQNNHFCIGSSNFTIPKAFVNDGVMDCPGPMPDDELFYISLLENAVPQENGDLIPGSAVECNYDEVSCDPYFPSCFPRGRQCVYDLDFYDHVTPCRKGQSLFHCKDYQCSGMFKCHESHCLPLYRVCDGRIDCDLGEDESNCGNYTCPGMLKCGASSSCIRQVEVCDGVVQCPHGGNDEELCHLLQYGCPAGCQCLGSAINCQDRNMTGLPENLDPEVRSLIMSNNIIELMPAMQRYTKLYRLDLSYNVIGTVEVGLFDRKTESNVMLRELYLHHNRIDLIQQYSFQGLVNLVVLTLHGNTITHVDQRTFTGLQSLPSLDLSGQQIRTVEEFTFNDLVNLEFLDLSKNDIKEISIDTFSQTRRGKVIGPISLMHLDISGNTIEKVDVGIFRLFRPNIYVKTDRFKFCCLAPQLKRCVPEPDEFTSCENLIENSVLRVFMWAISFMTLIGNVVILYQRLKHTKNTVPSLLMQHLAFADCMMGCYLLIIVSTDVHFRGNFIQNTDGWRPNVLCKLAGFLNMFSIVMSTLLVAMVSLDRIFSTATCIKKRGLGLRATRGLLALVWTTSVVVSILPVLEFDYFEAAKHDQNNICILYNLFRGDELQGWDFTVALFVISNILCHSFTGIGYALSWKMVTNEKNNLRIKASETLSESEKDAEIEFRKNERLITKRLIPMIITRVLLWLTVGTTIATVVLDYTVDPNLAAWTVLFVIPLSSALNPYLFTFSRAPFKSEVDELLLNWQEDLEEEDDGLLGNTDAPTGTDPRSTASIPSAANEQYQDAVLREMM